MSEVFLKILSALGILLLILLTAAAALLLLVLFFPVTYRISGKKDTEKTALSVKLNWLFGLLRLRYGYPSPQLLTVRLLCFKLFEMRLPPEDGEDREAVKEPEDKSRDVPQQKEDSQPPNEVSSITETQSTEGENAEPLLPDKEENSAAGAEASQPPEETGENEKTGKFLKIKYTILEMYDKIKKMWENISYYLSILQEEDTKQLAGKAWKHLLRLLKSIRPRHIRADILFGTGEPDTTGYAYGAYCMLTPFFGSRFLVTPDFERKIFQGEFKASGHIIAFVLLINVLKVAFDKRLHLLIKKLKGKNKGG